MPYKEIELPQNHGENQEECLNDQPDRIETHHSGVNPKSGFSIAQEYVLDQDAESEDHKSQPQIEEHHD